jgi:RNA polymerase sigma-70 factor (ECF subfamily)
MTGENNESSDGASATGFSTHATLLLRIKAAEPQPREVAWREFRQRYAPIIAGFARNLGARPQDVDDVIQDVLVGFYARSAAFVYDPSKGRFRGYLKVCTFRVLRRRLGTGARFRAVPIEEVDPESLEVDQVWNDVWEQEQLKRALDATREEYRGNDTFRAFELYVILGRPPEEVAVEVGLSIDSVYKAKARVTRTLRKRLRALTEEHG